MTFMFVNILTTGSDVYYTTLSLASAMNILSEQHKYNLKNISQFYEKIPL